MKTDIRIIVKDGRDDLVEIANVVYTDDGEVSHTHRIAECAGLFEAYTFLDKMYKASLKPALVKLESGEYE